MAKLGGGPRLRVKSSKPAAGVGAAGSPAIPDKLYFRIGEVAALCRVPTYVLRFWQTEFAELRPGKSGTGQRLYRRRDVEMALRIKRLLHEDGYTIAGARAVLAEDAAVPARLRLQPELPMAAPAESQSRAASGATPDASGERAKARLQQVRVELRELLGMLERKPAPRPLVVAPEPLFRDAPPERASE